MTAPGRTRRALMGWIGFSLAALASRNARATQDLDRPGARRALAAVRVWGCQYQNVDPDAIGASPLDLIVVDPSLDDARGRMVGAADLARMTRKPYGGRRLVFAYLSVGEADVKRSHWPQRWRRDPPAWLGPENPDWPGARYVRYWEPEWQAHVISLLDGIVTTGFDGVLLDRVDAYGDWERERPRARDDMVDLVQRVAARGRAARAGLLLLPQNAEHLLARPEFVRTIDGHNKESLLTGLRGPGIDNAPSDVEWSLGLIGRARTGGVVTFATEYLDDERRRAPIERRLRDLGFVPFFGRRALDELPRA